MIKRDCIENLSTNHDEADTRICLHAISMDESLGIEDIIIRGSDTDIAIIMVHHAHKLRANLWMDVGTNKQMDKRHYVNLTGIARNLGPMMCSALPGFHAYAGSDYISAFVGRGEARPLASLEKDIRAQKAFVTLAVSESLDEQTQHDLEMFTCRMYGAKDDC